MATLLESVSQSVTPKVLSALGHELELDEQMVLGGLHLAGLLVQGVLAEASVQPHSLDILLRIMPEITAAVEGNNSSSLLSVATGDEAGGLLGSLLGSLLAGGVGSLGDGNSNLVGGLLASLFGDGLGAIRAMLDQRMGFKVGPLLAVVALLAVNQISKLMNEQNLDTSAIAAILQNEHRAFLETGGETALFVQQALHAGQEAILLRQKFSTEEWTAVRMGPLAAMAMVMQASPSGAVGQTQEITAALYGVAERTALTRPTSLLQTVFATALSPDDFRLYTTKTPHDQLLEAIQNAATLVATKAPGSAADYKQMVIIVAAKAAEAAKEGGFLGIGGAQVSNTEKAALASIATALGELG
jgi:hypothetical protein